MLFRYHFFFLVLLISGLSFNAQAQGHRHHKKGKENISDSTLAASYKWEGSYVYHPLGNSGDFPSYTLVIKQRTVGGYMCELIYATKDHIETYRGIGNVNYSSFKIFFSEYAYSHEQPIPKNLDISLKFVNGKLLTYGKSLGLSPNGGALLKKQE